MTDDTKDPITVPSVDLTRYLGTWYEIARLPFAHEDIADRDVIAQYSFEENGKIHVVNRCVTASGEQEVAVGVAEPVDPSNAKLEISFLPEGLRWVPFTKGDYWILRLDPDYTTALVGTPDRKHLWLLSRTPRMDPARRDEWLATASAQGFDLTDIIHTPQTDEPFPSAK
ncbi:lipocalin family protein [Pedomonas mirosovicensis]|uniref:lipocalin family protein n=1 Tax=Pedomonas mirosovicensis TaxID=2908641 RepID=UPI00216A8AF1|nr:lipocalin family protein [Pedomonas mirosovicensis]MCH8684246.1 lipocalin family protein [Pedomonas mirosovicensis]